MKRWLIHISYFDTNGRTNLKCSEDPKMFIAFCFYFKENYGRHESECVKRVKEVYSELKLQELYANFEESSYSELTDLIDRMTVPLPKEMFKVYAMKIYKRQK